MTYSEAIAQVMRDNGGFAPLKLLYENIWHYKDKAAIKGKTPIATIQEKVQRDPLFTRIANSIYALTDFIAEVEQNDLGFFTFEENKMVFKPRPNIANTERAALQTIRIGQSSFRKNLMEEMKCCPITGIDEPQILVASHIKPWSHSDNADRMNIKNGLLLSPLFDKLFDKNVGLITFTPEKRVLISSQLSNKNANRLPIQHNQIIENLMTDGREDFLAYHRTHIFKP